MNCGRRSCSCYILTTCPHISTRMAPTAAALGSTSGKVFADLFGATDLMIAFACSDSCWLISAIALNFFQNRSGRTALEVLFITQYGSRTNARSLACREVRSAMGRGKGIPHSLRAFARVMCALSSQGQCRCTVRSNVCFTPFLSPKSKMWARPYEAHALYAIGF